MREPNVNCKHNANTHRHTHRHADILSVTIDKPQRQQLRQLPLADPLPLPTLSWPAQQTSEEGGWEEGAGKGHSLVIYKFYTRLCVCLYLYLCVCSAFRPCAYVFAVTHAICWPCLLPKCCTISGYLTAATAASTICVCECVSKYWVSARCATCNAHTHTQSPS